MRPHWTGFGHGVRNPPRGWRSHTPRGAAELANRPRTSRRGPEWPRSVRGDYSLPCAKRASPKGESVCLASISSPPRSITTRRDLPGATFVVGDDILEQLEVQKAPAEVAMMRHSSAVAVEMMDALLSAAAPGRTDGDLAAAAFEVGTRYGATPYPLRIYRRAQPLTTGIGHACPPTTRDGTTRRATSSIRISSAVLTATSTTSNAHSLSAALTQARERPWRPSSISSAPSVRCLQPGNRACDAHAAGSAMAPGVPLGRDHGGRGYGRSFVPCLRPWRWGGLGGTVDHRRGRDHFRTRDDSSDRRGDSASRGCDSDHRGDRPRDGGRSPRS